MMLPSGARAAVLAPPLLSPRQLARLMILFGNVRKVTENVFVRFVAFVVLSHLAWRSSTRIRILCSHWSWSGQ